MKILVTGFEPFDGLDMNSSEVILNLIDIDVYKLLLPVSYKRSRELLINEIEKIKPDFVLSFGQAGGDSKIRVEKFGLNYQNARIADNDGILIKGGKITQGSLAYTSNYKLEDLVDKLNENKIPAYLSLSAGGYICNTVYYTALEKMNGNAIFIHLPYIEGSGLSPQVSSNLLKKMAHLVLNELEK